MSFRHSLFNLIQSLINGFNSYAVGYIKSEMKYNRKYNHLCARLGKILKIDKMKMNITLNSYIL